MIAGIETGGTKVVCALAERESPTTIVDRVTIPTRDPEATWADIAAFLRRADGGIDGVGLASFGPVEVVPESGRLGTILASPKPGWPGFDQLAALRGVTDAPVFVTHDVGGSALGELELGSGAGLQNLAYATVGTGIGVGAVVGGRPLAGLGHPEMGHVLVRRHPDDDYAGRCPFHGDCLEGLASGPAVEGRWGRPGDALGDDTAASVRITAYYLAQLAMTISLTVCPDRIVLGGGVAKTPGLLDAVRAEAAELVAGYLEGHPVADPASGYLVPPALGDDAGVLGALILAERQAAGRADA